MTTTKKYTADAFINAAIIQSNQMDAKEKIQEWYDKQESNHTDISFAPEEIARIEKETDADLSHLWKTVPYDLRRKFQQS